MSGVGGGDPVLLIVGELRGKLAALEGYTVSIDGDVKALSKNITEHMEKNRSSLHELREAMNVLRPGLEALIKWRSAMDEKEQSARDRRNRLIGWAMAFTTLGFGGGFTLADRIAAVFKAMGAMIK